MNIGALSIGPNSGGFLMDTRRRSFHLYDDDILFHHWMTNHFTFSQSTGSVVSNRSSSISIFYSVNLYISDGL